MGQEVFLTTPVTVPLWTLLVLVLLTGVAGTAGGWAIYRLYAIKKEVRDFVKKAMEKIRIEPSAMPPGMGGGRGGGGSSSFGGSWMPGR